LELTDLKAGGAIFAFGLRWRPPVLGRMLRIAAAARARSIPLGDLSPGEVGNSTADFAPT